jgi:hypothetical protein
MNDRDLLRSAIAGALSAVRRGDDDDALVMFGQLAESTGLTIRDSVLELTDANVEMLRTLTGDQGPGDVLFTLSNEDDGGEPLSINDVEPAQRATIRILLAVANGNRSDADLHWRIVEDAPEETAAGQVFVHTLSWTMELLDACEEAGRLVPAWLRPVLTGH